MDMSTNNHHSRHKVQYEQECNETAARDFSLPKWTSKSVTEAKVSGGSEGALNQRAPLEP